MSANDSVPPPRYSRPVAPSFDLTPRSGKVPSLDDVPKPTVPEMTPAAVAVDRAKADDARRRAKAQGNGMRTRAAIAIGASVATLVLVSVLRPTTPAPMIPTASRSAPETFVLGADARDTLDPPTTAVEPDPARAKDLLQKAKSSLEKGDFPGAIRAATAASDVDPTDAASYVLWATALTEQGKRDAARKVYATCAERATRGPRETCHRAR